MGKSTDYGSMGLYLDILGSSHNGVLHNRNVHNKLLDMGTANLMIIEEWHAGGDELIQVDRMQWKERELKTLLAKCSQFCGDGSSFVQTACLAIHAQVEDADQL
jgi:hypothetical protein